eukprot:3022077-Pyramimonas_sp.AAC.1
MQSSPRRSRSIASLCAQNGLSISMPFDGRVADKGAPRTSSFSAHSRRHGQHRAQECCKPSVIGLHKS